MTQAIELSTKDRFEIWDLIARFNRAADTFSPDDLADCFVEDGVFEGPSGGPRGWEQLRAFVVQLQTSPAFAHLKHGQHRTTNVIIKMQGDDSASLTIDLMVVVPGFPAPAIAAMGTYTDELVRTSGGWRFKHRVVTVYSRP